MDTRPTQTDILVFGAHPDDVELGCGGTLAKMTSCGHSLGIVDLTRGEMGTRGDGETRLAESLRAASILGARFRTALGMPDTRVTVDFENEKKIVEVIRIARPKVVFAPLAGDTHPDHQACADLVYAAWYKAGFGKYEPSLKPFRPARLIRYMLGQDNAAASFVVDVSAHMETRRSAIAAYESQVYGANAGKYEGKTRLAIPYFSEMLETRLKFYGNRILKDYGEPFVIKEMVELDDPGLLTDGHWVFKDPA